MSPGVMAQTKRGLTWWKPASFTLPSVSLQLILISLQPTRAEGSGRLESGTHPGLSAPDLLDGEIREVRSAVAGLQILP